MKLERQKRLEAMYTYSEGYHVDIGNLVDLGIIKGANMCCTFNYSKVVLFENVHNSHYTKYGFRADAPCSFNY